MRERVVLAVCALAGVALGLPYVLHAFGPTEVEVVQWGWASIVVAAVLAGLALLVRKPIVGWTRYVIVGALLALALLQLPPAVLWVLFHGGGISDGSPPSSFVANGAFALPHIGLLSMCTVGLSLVARRAAR